MFDAFDVRDADAAGVNIHFVVGGSGPPLLLLHGYPQTHVMWHKVAPGLVQHFTVVAPDLRGYGDSAKLEGGGNHEAYSKRQMAADQVALMHGLGFEAFAVAAHDRGARVAHRMALDHPSAVTRLALLDIAPTLKMYGDTDQGFATDYYHWFFLIQPAPFPETLIGADPAFYLRHKTAKFSNAHAAFSADAMAEYIRCFSHPETIHATCEDYRASAGIDLDHDRADLDTKIDCPLLVLWGEHGAMERHCDMLAVWRERASNVRGRTIACGHFLAEEAPAETEAALLDFLRG